MQVKQIYIFMTTIPTVIKNMQEKIVETLNSKACVP